MRITGGLQPGFMFLNIIPEETEEGEGKMSDTGRVPRSPVTICPLVGRKQGREKELSSRRGWSVVNSVSFTPISRLPIPWTTALLDVVSLEIMSGGRSCCWVALTAWHAVNARVRHL